jgi:hypothetical protein
LLSANPTELSLAKSPDSTIPMTDVPHKIIHKSWTQKKKKKKTENFIDICENCWKLKTIGLLLQMHNTRCLLHTYVEIMEN